MPTRRMLLAYFVMILLSQDLTQKVSFPRCIPDRAHHNPYLLDLFLCSNLVKCSVSPHPSLGTSDHLVTSVDFDFMVKSTNEHPYHHNVYSFNKADWDCFRDYLQDVPWLGIFRHNVNKAGKEISDWIQIGIDCFIPHRKYQL